MYTIFVYYQKIFEPVEHKLHLSVGTKFKLWAAQWT
jgi:hypothetical protein